MLQSTKWESNTYNRGIFWNKNLEQNGESRDEHKLMGAIAVEDWSENKNIKLKKHVLAFKEVKERLKEKQQTVYSSSSSSSTN